MNELLNPLTINMEVESENSEILFQKLQNSEWKEALKSYTNKKLLLHMKREEVPVFIKELTQFNIPLYSIRPKHSLEDYFLSLTSK